MQRMRDAQNIAVTVQRDMMDGGQMKWQMTQPLWNRLLWLRLHRLGCEAWKMLSSAHHFLSLVGWLRKCLCWCLSLADAFLPQQTLQPFQVLSQSGVWPGSQTWSVCRRVPCMYPTGTAKMQSNRTTDAHPKRMVQGAIDGTWNSETYLSINLAR